MRDPLSFPVSWIQRKDEYDQRGKKKWVKLKLGEIVYQKIPPSTCTNKDREPKKHLQFQNLSKEVDLDYRSS